MKKIKKALVTAFMAFTMLGTACFGSMTAFADDQFATENAESKQKMEDVITNLKNAKKEDTANHLQALIDALEERVNDDTKLTSTEDVITMIEDTIGDKEFMESMGWDSIYTSNAATLETEWINAVGEFLVPYGVSMNKYSVSFTLNFDKMKDDPDYDAGADHVDDKYKDYSATDTGKDHSDKETAKSQSVTKSIQKLRWSSDSSSAVALSTYLAKFETTYIPTLGALLQSIAAALIVAYGASNLLKMSSDRMVSYDSILREFAKIILGVWFIFNYQYVAIVVLRVGTFITESLIDGGLSNEAASQNAQLLRRAMWAGLETVMQGTKVDIMFNGLSNAATGVYQIATESWTDSLGDVMNAVLGQISGGGWMLGGNTIISVAQNWVVFAILIELGIRYVFTPIAIADLYSEGLHSNGMRWLKKMLACAMTGGLIYLAVYGANVLKAQITGWHPIQYAAVNLTMTGFFVKCRMLADEIVGVR